MKKRILSMLLVVCMVFTLFPTAAFAEETAIGASSVADSGNPTTCQHKHDGTCDYFAAVEGIDCTHLLDGTYYCAPTDGVSENESTPSEAEYVCNHKDDCGYKEAVEGKDCTHTCELCSKESTPPSATDCDCDSGEKCVAANEEKGIEGLINQECPFCRVEGADLEQCTSEEAQKSFSLGVGAPNDGQKVYFGNTEGKDPALYRIVAQDDNTMTLFYNGENIATDTMQYNSSETHKSWSGSTICKWLNEGTFLGNPNIFTTAEEKAITIYGTKDEGANEIEISQKIVLPSVAEVKKGGIWEMSDSDLKGSIFWWLRSPGNYAEVAAVVSDTGSVDPDGYPIDFGFGVRPAFKLDLDSVLFASAATGGKSDEVDVDLSEAVLPTGDQKLTIVDSEHKLTTATTTDTLTAGETITVSYTGASIGTDVYLSAIVTGADGAITHYGALAEKLQNTSGTASVTLPGGFDSNSMKLKLFTETRNGEKLTDYASEPVVVTKRPASGTVPMPWGQDFEVNKDSKETTTKIMYGGETWLVIGSGDTGVVPDTGTMTLLANDNIIRSGNVTFDDATNNYGKNTVGSVEQSNLKTVIDGLAETTDSGGLFTAKEQSAIKLVTLLGGADNKAKKGMHGDNVEAKLWPLDVDEAEALNSALRSSDINVWWLRSPGYMANFVALVHNTGPVQLDGDTVVFDCGVRPAFKLNLDSVLFASAATGGKSGAASADLSEVVKQPTVAQKLTLLDKDNLNSGTITATGTDSNKDTVLKVTVEGATPNESLSAIITDSTGKVIKYYGKIANTDSSGAVTKADLTLPVNLGDENVLKIFVEEINSDSTKTDYASMPVPVKVTASFTPQTNTVTANDEQTLGLVGTTAVSSAEAVATAEIKDDKIEITSVSAGTVIITVKNAANNEATIAVTVGATGAITIGEITKYKAPPAGTHNVTYNLTDITAAGQPTSVANDTPLNATLTANSGHTLPDSITVTMGGNALTAGTGYTYSKGTKVVSIAKVTGDVVITAVGVGDSGGGSSSGNNGNVTVTPPTSNQPKEPTKTEIKLDTKVDSEEGAIINITNKNMTDAIEKAIADAKKNGKEADGISLVFRSDTGTNEVNKLTVQLPKTVQEMMINNKVASTVVVMDNLNIKIELDLKAITKINQQAKTNVTLIVEKLDNKNLTGKAKTAIGNRPVFDFKVSYGNGKYVSSFGNGSVSVSIPYTLISGEKAGNVYGVYVDSKNKVQWITNSSYDATAKVLRFNTNYCSTYGVGYIADGVTFNDITDHWAKSDIEFVLARGLFTNTSATTFEPNTAMTRSMFVTALGKLAGINTNSYKTGKFTDVNGDADYAPYVNWAVSKGIITGTTSTTFSPNQTVTRQEMAVLLTNYAKAMGVTVLKSRTAVAFADSTSIQSGAQEAVKSMQMAGIIMGKEKNLFDPTGIATKAEVAAVLRRYVELGIDKVTAQGLDVNDSGQVVYYENGNLFTGTKTINDQTYYFGSDGICTKIDAGVPDTKK